MSGARSIGIWTYSLETGLLIHRREHGRRRHAVPYAHGDVADDADGGRGHAEVLQLHAGFPFACLQRLEGCLGGIEVRLGLLELLLARRAGLDQLLGALVLLLREAHGRLLGDPAGLVAFKRGLLASRVDLQQRAAGSDAVARLHEDLRDDPFDLRADFRRTAGLENAHILRGDRHRLWRKDQNADRRRSLSRRRHGATATTGREDHRGKHGQAGFVRRAAIAGRRRHRRRAEDDSASGMDSVRAKVDHNARRSPGGH